MPISAKSNGGGGGNTTYEIQGLKELNDLVNGIPAEFNKIFQTTGKKFSQSMTSKAQSQAPVKTGRLKKSIGGESTTTEMKFYANAPYARFVDQGTWRMAARPFFTSTKDEQIPKMIDELNKQVATYIRSNVRK